MSQVVWSQTATEDLNRHYNFIKLNNPDAAARAVQVIVSSDEIAGLRKLLVSFGKYGYINIIHYWEGNSSKYTHVASVRCFCEIGGTRSYAVRLICLRFYFS